VTRRYGIDLDGVCFDFVGAFSSWLKAKLNLSYEDNQITEYHWYRCIPGMSETDFFREFHNFGHAGMYESLGLIHGCVAGVHRMLANGQLWFITARPDYVKAQTIEAVKRAFGLDERQIVFSHGKDYKANAVNSLQIDTFVEDGPQYAESIAANTGAKVYLIDKPYNQKVNHPKIHRVISWDEILVREGLNGQDGNIALG
jgi:uncharacterized HAD superfamily protein